MLSLSSEPCLFLGGEAVLNSFLLFGIVVAALRFVMDVALKSNGRGVAYCRIVN